MQCALSRGLGVLLSVVGRCVEGRSQARGAARRHCAESCQYRPHWQRCAGQPLRLDGLRWSVRGAQHALGRLDPEVEPGPHGTETARECTVGMPQLVAPGDGHLRRAVPEALPRRSPCRMTRSGLEPPAGLRTEGGGRLTGSGRREGLGGAAATRSGCIWPRWEADDARAHGMRARALSARRAQRRERLCGRRCPGERHADVRDLSRKRDA